jgi:hypothetical protein
LLDVFGAKAAEFFGKHFLKSLEGLGHHFKFRVHRL